MLQDVPTKDNQHTIFLRWLPQSNPAVMGTNLLKNWYFPLSALAYFFSEVRGASEYGVMPIALALTFIIMLIVATQVPELWQ